MNIRDSVAALSHRYKLALLAIGGLLALVCLLLIAGDLHIASMRQYTYDDIEEIPHNRVALVLGTAKYLVDGGRNEYFQNRILAAAELYHRGKADYILVSGDNATIHYNEPRQMRRELLKQGIPGDAIFSDYAGFRTLDSIIRAREVFGQQHLTVVSQGFHNERAIFIGRHIGMDIVGYNAQDVTAYRGIKTRLREVMARLKCLLDVYVLGMGPKFLGEPVVIGPRPQGVSRENEADAAAASPPPPPAAGEQAPQDGLIDD